MAKKATVTVLNGADASQNARAQLNFVPLPEFAAPPTDLLLLRRSLLVSSFDRLAIEQNPTGRTPLLDAGDTPVVFTPTAVTGTLGDQRLFAPHIALNYATGFAFAVALTMRDVPAAGTTEVYVATSDDWRNTTNRRGMMLRLEHLSGPTRSLRFEVSTAAGTCRPSRGANTVEHPVMYAGFWDPAEGDGTAHLHTYATGTWDDNGATGTHSAPNPTAGLTLRSRTQPVTNGDVDLHMLAVWDEPLGREALRDECVRLDAWLLGHGVDVLRA
jgi:hypothetical protein